MAEKVAIEVIIEASKSAKTLKELNKSIEDLNDELAVTDKSDSAFRDLSKAIDEAEDSMADLLITADKSKLTFGELELAQEKLLDRLKEVDRGSAEFKALQKEIVKVNKEIGNTELGLIGLNSEDVAGAFGQLTGAVGTITSSFILLGNEGDETLQQIAQNIERAIGISQVFQGTIEGISAANKLWQNYGGIIKDNTLLTKAATKAQGVYNGIQALFGKAVDTSSKSLKGFKTALLATGIGAIIVAVGLLIANFDKLKKALGFVSSAQENANQITSEAIEAAGEELSAIDSLKGAINDETLSREELNDRIATLQEEYPELLSNMDAENASRDQLIVGLEKYSELVLLRAEQEAAASLEAEKFKEKLELETEAITGQNNGWIEWAQSVGLGIDAQTIANAKTANAINLLNEETEAIRKDKEARQERIKEIEKELQLDRESKEEQKKKEAEEKRRQEAGKKRRAEQKAAEEKAKQDEIKRLEDLDKFQEELLQMSLDRTEDLQARKLLLEFEAQKKRAEELIKDEQVLVDALEKINKEYFKQLVKLEDDAIKLDKEKQQTIINLNKKTADALDILEQEKALIDAEAISDEVAREKEKDQILKKLADARIKQLKTNSDIQLQDTKLTEDQRKEIILNTELEISKIKEEQRVLNAERDQQAVEQQKEINEQLVSAGFEVLQTLSDAAFEIAQQNRDQETEKRLQDLTDRFEQENSLIEYQLNQGIISERKAEREREKLEKKRAKEEDDLKRQAFEQNKKASIAQALINGAIAITQAFAQLGPIAGAIAAALVAVNTGVQIASISNQKYALGGILEGASHEHGGIKTPFGEMEGGEAVINKTSTELFKNELSTINQAGGGVAFARGGVTGTGGISTTQDSTDLTSTLQNLNQTLQNPVRAFVVETEITSTQNRANYLENNATL